MARWLLSIFGLFVVLQAYGSLAYPKGRFAKAPKPQWSYVDHGKDPLACALCLDAMKEVYKLATANRTEQCLEALVDKFCKVLNIEDSTVCRGAIAEYGDIFLFVVDNLLFDPKRVCGTIFDGCGGPKPPIQPNGYWRVPMLNTTKPPRQKPVLPDPGKPTLRVVHLADLHFDKYYAEGSEADCNEPLCCRKTNASQVKQPAGKWGISGKCDIPKRTLESMLQHVASRTDFDYVIWTGDAPPHNVWNQSKSDQLEVLSTLTDLFTKYFPNRLLISAVGNHESAPANNYPPHSETNIPNEYSTAWLYQTFADQWTQYGIGKDPDIYQSIQNLASYVTKPYPGLRVVSLNTMFCLGGNFWLYLNEYDPDNVLAWLMNQLQAAEDAGDKVHIMGHVPPGSCLKEWSANFYDIVNRYENTITGMFFGHTHRDTFQVFYENGTLNDPIQVAYVAPSGTVFSQYWPSYRIYTIDGNYEGSSFRVLDHETYMLNLTDANASDKPKWELEYKAKDAYNMDSLLPEAWNDLIQRFMQDDDLFQKYFKHVTRAPTGACQGTCKHDVLCDMRAARSHDSSLCQDIPNGGDKQSTNGGGQLTEEEQESIRQRVEKEFAVLPNSCVF